MLVEILYSDLPDNIDRYYSNELDILIIDKRRDEELWQADQLEKEEKLGHMSLT